MRVLPRDLFNEAKLLNNLGRLCLLMVDAIAPELLNFDETGDPFNIELSDEGNMYVSNLQFDYAGTPVHFYTTYNSREKWPLLTTIKDEEISVFDDNGDFTAEFLLALQSLECKFECKNPTEYPQECPYSDDVDNETSYCHCCDKCRKECAGSI